MVVLLVFMPCSPRRLLSLGREQQAEEALRWLRGQDYDIHTELSAIKVKGSCCFNNLRGMQFSSNIILYTHIDISECKINKRKVSTQSAHIDFRVYMCLLCVS